MKLANYDGNDLFIRDFDQILGEIEGGKGRLQERNGASEVAL